MKKHLSAFIRILGTFLLLAFILSKVDVSDVVAHIRKVPFYLLFLIFLWYVATQLLGVYRWKILLRTQGIDIPFGRLFVVTMKALYFNMVLPTAMGGDVIRGYALYKNAENRSAGVASVLVDRMIGMTAMVGIALFSVLWGGRYLSETPFTLAIFSFAGLYFLGLALLATSMLKRMTGLVLRVLPLQSLSEKIMSFYDVLFAYFAYKKTMGFALVLSLLLQAGVIFTYFFVAMLMHINVSLFHFFLFMPVVWIISMLPVSIGGLGLREGAFIFLFTKVGIPKEACFSLSILATAIAMVLGLLGGLFFLVPDKQA